MNDPEVQALSAIAATLETLSEEQRRHVLLYVNSRFGGRGANARAAGALIETPTEAQHASLGDFFDSADPQSEADRVLVVGYWKQVVEKVEDFEAFPVNAELKQLGHPVSNITRSFDTLINQTPRLIMQTAKTGKSQQARKRYKLTREGIRTVESMVSKTKGDSDVN